MNKKLFAILMAFVSLTIQATTMHYDLTFDADKHYVDVTLTIGDVSADHLLLKMPVWAPGYYLILDSPKHVSDFSAADNHGNIIKWDKQGKNGWNLNTKGAKIVTVHYRVFANRQSVGEAKVDATHAFLPGNEIYLYIDGHKDLPVSVCVIRDSRWASVVTSLPSASSDESANFVAKDFDTLVDSPIYCGNPTLREFEHEGHHYTLCVEDARDLDLDNYISELKSMITAATSLMGDVPYDKYVFLWMGKGQGGLEHLSSQACFTDEGLYSTDPAEHVRWMNFATHEYYHLYNVKSIRPYELGPFDYDRECFTDQLWVSEGLTVYYEFALMLRAGLASPQTNLQEWADYIRDVEQTPGREHMSLASSSYDIWLNFFDTDENRHDVTISYYVKGPVVGGMLDLAIRHATHNEKSIDDLMRRLYNRYYRELQRGFHPEEFWAEASDIAGYDLADIRQMVYTTLPIDYARYLRYAGIEYDASTYTLTPMTNPNNEQLEIRKAVFGQL